jgi:phage terminase Nu1 subunit (DNA packaging protein)
MTDDISDIKIVNRTTRPLSDEQALAELLDVSVRTLQTDRQRGDGIPFIKLGRSVRYDPKVVEQYLRAQTWVSTSQTEEQGAAI